jgi:hypothetical protein
MFKNRSYKLERLDTGDYTAAEYDVCLSELRFINRWIGDTWALKATLLRQIESLDLRGFSFNSNLITFLNSQSCLFSQTGYFGV